MPADHDTIKKAVLFALAHPANLASMTKIQGPNGVEPFVVWPRQKVALDMALYYRWTLALKARQLGMTWTFGSLLGLWDVLTPEEGMTLVLSRNEDDAKQIINRARFLYQNLPQVLREHVWPLSVDRTDRLEVKHPNGYTSALISLSSSGGSGRGYTLRRVIADEVAHWDEPEERMSAIMPTVADAGSMIALSTAKGYGWFYDMWMGAADPKDGETPHDLEGRSNGFARMFFGALDRPDRTKEKMDRERARLGHHGPQEYPYSPSEAFIGSGNCVFDEEAIEAYMREVVAAPEFRAEPGDGAWRVVHKGDWKVWSDPVPARSYIISADPCGGGGGRDYASAHVIDWDSWDIVATFHGRPEPLEFANQLEKVGKLYNEAMLAPESNTHGQGVISVLLERKYPAIYLQSSNTSKTRQSGQNFGFMTSQKSKSEALGYLKEAVRARNLGIPDGDTIREMSYFVETESGREEAEKGKHDDRVMSLAIGAHILSSSKKPVKKQRTRKRTAWKPRLSPKWGV